MKTGIVAFAFGAPCTIISNEIIAEIVLNESNILLAPIYTQIDIIFNNIDIDVTYIEEIAGPPPTLRIARGAVRWAEQRGLDRLRIICAKPHLWRVMRDLSKAITEAKAEIEIEYSNLIFDYSENVWFCPESAQPRTRSEKKWNKRERILKHMPFWLYKLIAS